MAICVDGNVVCFGGGNFCQTPTGIAFTGEAVADSFVDCRTSMGFGSSCGYSSLGARLPFNLCTNIERFPFASDSPASDIGNLTEGRYNAAGTNSTVAMYAAGGFHPGVQNFIDKFPFAQEGGDGTDVGDLSQARDGPAGHSSPVSGYNSGGNNTKTIDKFPFASDANATAVGQLANCVHRAAGTSSVDAGFAAGTQPTLANIEKFPFASDGPATDIGELSQARHGRPAGQSSSTHGYSSGGTSPSGPRVYTIDKFPFASGGTASNVGNLLVNRRAGSGQSSTASGYTSGGQQHPAVCNTIDKFPFASDANASDVGDLTQGRYGQSGHQV